MSEQDSSQQRQATSDETRRRIREAVESRLRAQLPDLIDSVTESVLQEEPLVDDELVEGPNTKIPEGKAGFLSVWFHRYGDSAIGIQAQFWRGEGTGEEYERIAPIGPLVLSSEDGLVSLPDPVEEGEYSIEIEDQWERVELVPNREDAHPVALPLGESVITLNTVELGEAVED